MATEDGRGAAAFGLPAILLGLCVNPWSVPPPFGSSAWLGGLPLAGLVLLELAWIALGIAALRSGRVPRAALSPLLLVSASAPSLYAFRALGQPCAWSAAFVAAGALAAAVTSPGRRGRLAGTILALVAAGFWCAETYVGAGGRRVSISPRISVGDPVLWSRPLAGAQARARRWVGAETLYDVTYSIDASGWRVGPPTNASEGPWAVFVGCSYTFGEGVADAETLPYRVGLASGGAWRTLNISQRGWGSHQLLAAAEMEVERPVVGAGPVRRVIYSAIADHVARAAGRVSYGETGPRYLLDASGVPFRSGRVRDRWSWAGRVARRSNLFWLLMSPGASTPDEADIALFSALVDRTRTIVEARYPGAEFHVIFWEHPAFLSPIRSAGRADDAELSERMIRDLERRGVRVHRVSAMIPPGTRAEELVIHRTDSHPSASAYALVARYVAARILRD